MVIFIKQLESGGLALHVRVVRLSRVLARGGSGLLGRPFVCLVDDAAHVLEPETGATQTALAGGPVRGAFGRRSAVRQWQCELQLIIYLYFHASTIKDPIRHPAS
jgi:hypothetical protein